MNHVDALRLEVLEKENAALKADQARCGTSAGNNA
jgi:hypothetical protein